MFNNFSEEFVIGNHVRSGSAVNLQHFTAFSITHLKTAPFVRCAVSAPATSRHNNNQTPSYNIVMHFAFECSMSEVL